MNEDTAPAFPQHPACDSAWDEGMNYREWFASAALIGLIARTPFGTPMNAEEIVSHAYEIADEMLKGCG